MGRHPSLTVCVMSELLSPLLTGGRWILAVQGGVCILMLGLLLPLFMLHPATTVFPDLQSLHNLNTLSHLSMPGRT